MTEEEKVAAGINDRSDEGEVSGLRAITKIRGRLQPPTRVAGRKFEGDAPDKAVKDQLAIKVTEADILEMAGGVEEPELKNDTFSFWLPFALPGHNDASPQSAYKRAFCKSAEELNKKLGNIDPVTGKPFGWKKLVDEVVTLEFKDIKWKIKNDTTGEAESKTTKTWYFSDSDSAPANLDVLAAELIAGKDPATAMRSVMGSSKISRDPKYKEAIKTKQPIAGLELIDGVYQKVPAPSAT